LVIIELDFSLPLSADRRFGYEGFLFFENGSILLNPISL